MDFVQALIMLAAVGAARELPPRDSRPCLFLIGDSTVCDVAEHRYPQQGWGQGLRLLVKDDITLENHAMGGRSTKSFRDEGRWQKVLERLRPGDFVLIQFGHNDQKPDEPRHTDPFGAYQDNLRRYIRETRERGAEPIIVTSVHRHMFGENGKIRNSLGDYPRAAREVAKEQKAVLVDLHALSEKLFNELGEEGTKQVFCHLKAGEFPNYPKGRVDNSHFRAEGARRIAALVVDAIRASESPLARHLKPREAP